MAAITKIHLTQLPNWQRSGTSQGVQQAAWDVETDDVYPSGYVMAIAQGLTGSFTGDASGSKLVPVRSNILAMDNGDVVPGITVSNAPTWIAAGTDRYADGSAYALDEQCQPLEAGPTKSHRITIGFRAPQPGRLERPGFLTNFASGIGSTFPTPPTSTTTKPVPTPAEIVTALDTTNQPADFHTEYRMEEVLRYIGRPVTLRGGLRTFIGNAQPRVNINGELLDPIAVLEPVETIVVERIVGTDVFATQLNAAFKNTINSDQITTYDGQIVPPFTARFLIAETSRPRTEGGTEYKVLTFRVEKRSSPYFDYTPMTGSFYLSRSAGSPTQGGTLPPLVRTVDKDDDGFPIVSQYPLKIDGTKAETVADQHVIVETKHNPVPYGALLQE